MQFRFTLKNMGRGLRVLPILFVLLCAFAGTVSAQCTWTAATVYPVTVLDIPAATVGTNLYAFAGVANGAIVATSNKFDGTTWTAIAPTPQALEYPSAVSDGTNIFVMGGANTTGASVPTNYRYNVATNTYTTMAPSATATATWNHAAVLLNNKIYKIGGIITATPTGAVEIYDIAANTWSTGAAYPTPGGFISAVAIGGYIYAAGGINTAGTTKSYRYDPATNTWDDAAIADLPASRWGAATVVYRNAFVMAGGYVGGDVASNVSTSVISWDPLSNTWTSLASLIGEKSRFAGAILNDNFYTIGGRSIASAGFLGTNSVQQLTCPPLVACTGTPNPGNTFATATVVCPNTPVTLSAQNATSGTGITYQWETSADGVTGWTNATGTSTNPTYGFTATVTAFYRVKVTCATGATTGTSNPVKITITPCTCINPDAATICEGVTQKLTVAGAGVPGTATATSGTIAVNVPDASAAGITTGLPLTLPAGASVTSISVNFNLTHTWDSDMTINLIAPDGSVFNLVNARGGSGDNFVNTTVSTSSTNSFATGAAPFTGTFAPDYVTGVGPTAFLSTIANFAALPKLQPSGLQNWRLGLRDVAFGDVGILTSWSITVNYTVLPTAIWTGGTFFTSVNPDVPYTAGTEANTVYVRPAATTTYVATIASGTCAGANNVTVTVLPRPVVTVTPATACGPVLLTASGANSYVWTPSTGLSAITGASVTANPTATTTYTVTGTSNNGCSGLPASAVVNAAPTASIISAVAGATFQINEGFETVLPAGWSRVNNSTPPLGVTQWVQGSAATLFPAFNGTANSYAWANFNATTGVTGNETLSAWMISPVLNVKNGDVVSFYTRTVDGPTFADRLQVRLSTAGASTNVGTTPTSVGDFTVTLVEVNAALTASGYPSTWTKFTAVVSGLPAPTTGRIAFRYFVTNGGPNGANSDNIGVDQVEYSTPATVNCANVVTNLKVDITGGVGPYTVVFSNGTTSTTISNYTSGSNIQVSPAATTTYTIVSVTGANGCVGTNNSGSATITITPPAAITTQPAAVSVCAGSNATFNVVATPAVGNTYQWQVATAAAPTVFTNISGATGTSYVVTAATSAQSGNIYRVVVTGACGAAVTSGGAVLTVNTAAVITTQPVATSVCATPSTTGTTATFSVVATGGGLTYQWQVSTDNGTTYTNVANGTNYSGATTSTLTVTAATTAFNNYLYRVLVTTAGCTSVTSGSAALTIKPATVVVLSASPYTSLYPGLTTTLTAAVSPSTATSYTWFRNNVVVAGALTNTLAGITVDQLGDYKVAVTDANGCGGVSNTITIGDSSTTTLFIYPNPTNNGVFHVRYFDQIGTATFFGARTLTIFDSKGSRVFSKVYSATSAYTDMTVDISNQGRGIYTVDLTNSRGERLKTGRVVVL